MFPDNNFDTVAEKDRQLGAAQGEIKALRATEVLKDKAIEEVLRISMQANSVKFAISMHELVHFTITF